MHIIATKVQSHEEGVIKKLTNLIQSISTYLLIFISLCLRALVAILLFLRNMTEYINQPLLILIRKHRFL